MTENFKKHEITVIGAGIVGISCALYLQRDGHQVTVIDNLEPGQGCSSGNGGQIMTDWSAPMGMPGIINQVPGWLFNPLGPLKISWRYLPKIAPWLIRLVASSSKRRVESIAKALYSLHRNPMEDMQALINLGGAQKLVHSSGRIDVYRNQKSFAKVAPKLELLSRHGMLIKKITQEEIRKLEPELEGCFEVGVFFPETFWTSNPLSLVQKFAEAFLNGDGTILKERVKEFVFNNQKISHVVTDKGKYPTELVVLAAGAYSRDLAEKLGSRIPLDTERGYHVKLPHAGVNLSRPVIFPDHYFGMTPMEDGLRLGGVVEFAGIKAPPNYRHVSRLIRSARLVFPKLDTKGAVPWMGCRPSIPDSMPVIGASPTQLSAFFAFGHGHHGLGGSARTGKLLSDLVAGRHPVIDPYPFRPNRF